LKPQVSFDMFNIVCIVFNIPEDHIENAEKKKTPLEHEELKNQKHYYGKSTHRAQRVASAYPTCVSMFNAALFCLVSLPIAKRLQATYWCWQNAAD
jgi:hypothetical protein